MLFVIKAILDVKGRSFGTSGNNELQVFDELDVESLSFNIIII